MRFEVTILGSSSATPIFYRNPTSQLLNINEKFFLIDCGEGTQQQMLRYGIKAQRIGHIFISHLHGDHYLGLVGLLSSLHLNGRTKPMFVYGPPELEEIIEMHFRYSQTTLRYPLEFPALQASSSALIFENADVRVETIILDHRIPCTGFKFSEKQRLRPVIKEKIAELDIPQEQIPLIKRGGSFTDKRGVVHPASALTSEPPVPRCYAYCSDTMASGNYLQSLMNTDLLYHETTFLHEMADRAAETFHTTALQAAQVAVQAGAQKLIIGHFSARYRELEPLLEEARSVFPETRLAVEGETFRI